MSDCIEWTGARAGNGYGSRRVNGRHTYNHRLAWEQVHGPIPDGLHVLHHCDNPPCHNVEHLFLGTPADNSRDKVAKGRQRALGGEESPNARLTQLQVDAIRNLYAAGGITTVVLAREFGVCTQHVRAIIAGQRWSKSFSN